MRSIRALVMMEPPTEVHGAEPISEELDDRSFVNG